MRITCVGLFILALTSACAGQSRPTDHSRFLTADECAALPGLAGFRAELGRVVAARDAAAFAALFHPEGGMRVNGVGGVGNPARWNLSRMAENGVWDELDEILPLGCVQRDGRALLPAMFALVEDGVLDPEYDMAWPTSPCMRSRT